MTWLVVVVIGEGLKLFCNLSAPFFVISSGNIMLVAVHLIAACSVFGYAVSLLILRVPMRIAAATSTTALLAVGAWLDAMIFSAAIAAV